MLSSIPVSKVLSILLKELDLYLISLMLQALLISYFCLLFLSCGSAAIAQQNQNGNYQPADQNTGWQAPQGNQTQTNQSWQGQGQSQGGWQPLGTDQAGPSLTGNASTTQPNDQYQEPGAYLNKSAPNNAFNDTVSAGNGTQSGQSNAGTNSNTGNNSQQQGHVKKNHEGLKTVMTGMGRAFETAATVAAPIAGGYMMGRAMSAGYGSPYGMSPYGMSPYGGMGMGGYGMPMMSPYGGMGGYGMPMMNPYGMSSFMHY